MKSKATTVKDYLASLPEDRREIISIVREFLLDNLDHGLQECMQYGVIAYCVPLSGEGAWPLGHHTNPKLPLMYMGLSSQKNDMVVYMLFLLHNQPERAWFDKAWKATGRKNYLEVSGAGCCLRFKKIEDLSLDVIASAMRRMTVKKYLADHTAMLARLGKGPGGKPIKKSSGAEIALGSRRDVKAKSPSQRGKTAKTNTAGTRG